MCHAKAAPGFIGCRPVGYVLLLDSTTYGCRTWDDLIDRPVWARQQDFSTAKARFANGYVDRPLMPSEQARLVEEAGRLAVS